MSEYATSRYTINFSFFGLQQHSMRIGAVAFFEALNDKHSRMINSDLNFDSDVTASKRYLISAHSSR